MSAFRLPRWQRGVAIVGPDGKPTLEGQRWQQSTVEKIEAQEAAQDGIIADIQALQAEQTAIIADLAAQLALIQAAQATADAVTTANAISASWITPESVLAATDAGTDATITIADFTRVYDDGTAVDITGASLTGLAYTTTYAVYYDDTTRANATPTFHATDAPGTARHNYIAGRHYVDTITTPAAGGGGTSGGGYTPPGGGGTGGYERPPEA